MSDIKNQVREFVVDNFLFGDANGLSNETSFLEDGIIDSTGVLELVTYLEEAFAITVEDSELVPENLDSLNNVESYVKQKMALAA
jgi:acyl carrier protein